MRQKHTFIYHGEKFFCGDLTVEDYLLICIDPETGYEKIFSEFNEKPPLLNKRQMLRFINILFGGEQKKENVLDKLTETQKQIQAYKNKSNDKQRDDIEEMLIDWHIIEGQVMHIEHQSLSEIRKWPYEYFMKIYKDLPIITGDKEYKKDRHSETPNKQAFKSEFGDIYNK